MCRYSIHLEGASGNALSPLAVDEGAGRVSIPCDAADCAEFAIVDGELHLSHCGDESSDVRILRNGRTRTVRRGQSFRVLLGDSLCVAGREYRVRGLYREEMPRRRPILTAARTAAMAATAAALLAGCVWTDHHSSGNVARDPRVVDVKHLGGDVAPVDPVSACFDMNRNAPARANCCMAIEDARDAQACCDAVHRNAPKVYCEVDVMPGVARMSPIDICLSTDGVAKDKATCCMAIEDENDAQACCDEVHRNAPNEYCEVGLEPNMGEMMPPPSVMCLAKDSASDKATCCMAIEDESDAQACCDEVHRNAPNEYCEVGVEPNMGMMEPPSAIDICLGKDGAAGDKADCCMAIEDENDAQACCDSLHLSSPDVYCEVDVKPLGGDVAVHPIVACMEQNDTAQGKADCCMAIEDENMANSCCKGLLKEYPDVRCDVELNRTGGILPEPGNPRS